MSLDLARIEPRFYSDGMIVPDFVTMCRSHEPRHGTRMIAGPPLQRRPGAAPGGQDAARRAVPMATAQERGRLTGTGPKP